MSNANKTVIKEPARTKLFWRPIYKVVLGMIKDVIVDLWKSTREFVKKRKKVLWIPAFPFLIFVYPLLIVSCVIAFFFFSFVTIGNYIGGGIVYVIDAMYLKMWSIKLACPSCKQKFVVPVYICPKCGAQHKKLRPGRYGLLHRTCECGERLPSTCFTGRHKLDYACPHCGAKFKGNSFTHEITIPVIGGASSGKTCYINMAIRELEKKAASYNVKFELQEGQGAVQDYKRDMGLMESGKRPMATSKMDFAYYQFFMDINSGKKSKVRNLISLCDVAGEIYKSNNAANNLIFTNSTLCLVVIDPLSIRDFKTKVSSSRNISASAASADAPDSVLYTARNAITNPKLVDIAVVITKSDIPEVAERLGGAAIKNRMSQGNVSNNNEAEIINTLCMEFLKDYNATNFVVALNEFKSYQFFVASALGHDVDGTSFAPSHVEDAILWLFNKDIKSTELKAVYAKSV